MSRHDGRIGRRIAVYGPSGSGKSTLAAKLGAVLGVPHIEIDALHHLPDWGVPETESFRSKVRDALDATPDGFVIDGNYSMVRDIVWERAETAVWQRQPFRVVYPRVCRRTWKRVTTGEVLWGTNRERWQDVFGMDSMFRYGITAWRPHHAKMLAALRERPEAMRLFILRSDGDVDTFVRRARAERAALA